MRRRLLTAAAIAGLVAVAAPACAPAVCPAIGWLNQVTIHAEALPADAVDLQLVEFADSHGGFVDRPSDTEWQFSIDMGAPEAVTVRAVDAAGEPVAEAAVELDWQIDRPHGPRCPGPGTAQADVEF